MVIPDTQRGRLRYLFFNMKLYIVVIVCDLCAISLVYGQILCLELAQTAAIETCLETVLELSLFFFLFLTFRRFN